MKVNLSVDSDDPLPLRFDLAAGVFEKEIDLLWKQGVKKPDEAEVSITFVSSREMREQNALYRNINEPTDVLSFPLWEEGGEFSPQAEFPVLPLGDLLICPSQVASNAKNNNVKYEEELCLVIAHGFLHLLAFDHDTPEREAEMWKLQDKIKIELGCLQ